MSQPPLEKDSSPSSSSISDSNIITPLSSRPSSPPRTHSANSTQLLTRKHIQTLLLLAAIYPVSLALGSLFSNLSPIGQNKNYFSNKRNIFNVLLVKNGWLWTSAAFFLHLFRSHTRGSTNGGTTVDPALRAANTIKAIGRWVVATVFWIFITQWFFGPPLMDRSFTLTGGACEPEKMYPASDSLSAELKAVYSSAACKVAGGTWRGGHDLSGHVFMLTHASLFLWAEILPSVILWRRAKISVSRSEWNGVHWFVWGILGLWWWMLLMTAIYFHTWKERFTGWVVSLVEFGILYVWAIPNVPQARSLFGVPGV